MAMTILPLAGGLGVRLEVLGGETAPQGAENRIWVCTQQQIPGWIASALEPAEPQEGMVWLRVGGTGPQLALGEQVLLPLAQCLQYSAGEWLPREGRCCVEEAWVPFGTVSRELYLYGPGLGSEDLTLTNAQDQGEYLLLTLGKAAAATVLSQPVDLTDYTRIRAEFADFTVNSSHNLTRLELRATAEGQMKTLDSHYLSAGSSGTLEADVSELTGVHTLTFYGYNGSTNLAGSAKLTLWVLQGSQAGAVTPDAVVNTADATATAEDIAAGKTAYVKGQKITGTIPAADEVEY